jgi:hypothetical protein
MPMSKTRDLIRTLTQQLEDQLEEEVYLIEEFRRLSKTKGGRLTQLGKHFLIFAKENDMKQSYVAKLLDITPGAVSQHFRG